MQNQKSTQMILSKQSHAHQDRFCQSAYIRPVEMVGSSIGIRRILGEIKKVASTDAAVLILGETGTGKELVANSIYMHSSRWGKPFIKVNCNALSDALISSELFGHERGAFTGAVKRLIGRFELADGGVLFLDEIGDMPTEVQIKLLRTVQYREFERVGGRETIKADFRLITATHKDLSEEVNAGRFRKDLYYRINVFPIHVPPLRQRKEDIPFLADHFLRMFGKKYNKRLQVKTSYLERLSSYDWPGNVRELENVIERCVILADGHSLRSDDLDRILNDSTVSSPKRVETLKENERNHILRVLRQTGGKITGKGGAAGILAIHPATLHSRMRKLGIRRRIEAS